MVLVPRSTMAGPVLWIVVLFRELLVGFTVGLVASLVFRAAEAAGRLTDVLRGANMADVLSPTSEERTSPVGDLYLLLASVIFLELGGLGYLAAAIHRSYEAVPIGVASPAGLRGAATVDAPLIEQRLARWLRRAILVLLLHHETPWTNSRDLFALRA